jgi:hypothetical protein
MHACAARHRVSLRCLTHQVSRGSSVPRKLRHITGLRGAASTKVAVVALELDVHGTTRVGVRRAREPRA